MTRPVYPVLAEFRDEILGRMERIKQIISGQKRLLEACQRGRVRPQDHSFGQFVNDLDKSSIRNESLKSR